MDPVFLHIGHTVANSPFAMFFVMLAGGAAGLVIAFLPQLLSRLRRRPAVDTTRDDA